MYYELFKEPSSPDTNNENEFKSSLIPKTNHRVAKNSKGLPSILINTKNDDSFLSKISSKLINKVVNNNSSNKINLKDALTLIFLILAFVFL